MAHPEHTKKSRELSKIFQSFTRCEHGVYLPIEDYEKLILAISKL